MRSLIFLFTIFLLFISWGCQFDEYVTLPYSIGGIDEVVYVVDERYNEDTISGTFRSYLLEEYGFLPQPEPIFDLLEIDLEILEQALIKHRNLTFVAVLDGRSLYNDFVENTIGRENVEKIKSNDKTYYLEKKDVWAKGQKVRIIASNNYETLRKDLEPNLKRLVAKIQEDEEKKVFNIVYGAGDNIQLMEKLRKEHNINIRIPEYFKALDRSDGDFFFLRKSTVDLSSTIMIYQVPYTDSNQARLNYPISIRDSLGRRFESSRVEGSYMTTEKRIPYLQQEINYDGSYAIVTRGLWRLVNDFMGGPFVNYAIFDEKNARIIFLDAYIYAPDMKKRKLVRELECILSTFQLEKGLVEPAR